MKEPSFENVVEEDTDVDEGDLNVTVKCPFCSRIFSGDQDAVGDSLFKHLWKHHDEDAIDYMIGNMFLPDHVKEYLFSEMGPEYVSWLVDSGEIIE